MSRAHDLRGFVQRHYHFDTPMWRVQVYDDDRLLAMHIVLDWDEAIGLANGDVRRFRTLAEGLRQQIWEAYGLDEMTPTERANFEAYGRAVQEIRRRERQFAQAVRSTGRAIADDLSGLFGVEFVYVEEGAST